MNILAFDTESNDLVKFGRPLEDQPYIVELAMVLIDEQYNELETFDELMKPPVSIEPSAEKVNGITNEMVADKQPFIHFYPKIHELFHKADLIIAHNARFDRDMIMFEVARNNKAMDWDIDDKTYFCTLDKARQMYPHASNHKLETLHKELCDHRTEQTHRALDDVRLLIDVYRKMCER